MQQIEQVILKYKVIIEEAWEKRSGDITKYKSAINEILEQLDQGKIRVAHKKGNEWLVNEWVKKAIILSFKTTRMFLMKGTPQNSNWFDKFNSKFENWNHEDFESKNLRASPGCFIRFGSYFAKNVVIMPSFVNMGAYIDENTMIDVFASIGSCAQIGKNCHISQGAGIGGVLEPLQANPVIIEDNCFIGTGSQIVEGAIIEEGSVIGMGVNIGASTKIINRESGEISYGRIPKYSVVVPGNAPSEAGKPSLACAVIIKQVDEQTRNKTSINDLLRHA